MSAYSNIGTVLGIKYTVVNKIASPHFHWAYILVKGDRQ